MPKLLFVFNPHSGKGLIKTHLLDIINTFTHAGYDVTVHPTQGVHDGYRYICEHGNEYHRIVVSGGDGTLNKATRALMSFDEDSRPPLGYIPSGTTNDFATTLNIPKSMPEAAKIAAAGQLFKCDIGCFDGKYFNYVAAFGAFTDVSYDTPQETKNIIGHAAYVWEGIKRLPTLSPYKVNIKYDDGEIDEEVSLCLIMNSTTIGGVLSTQRLMTVDLADGLFEMLVFRQPTNPFELQQALTDIMMGKTECEGYTIVRSSRFEITSREIIKWTLDGEYGGGTLHSVIEVKPSAVTYILDKN